MNKGCSAVSELRGGNDYDSGRANGYTNNNTNNQNSANGQNNGNDGYVNPNRQNNGNSNSRDNYNNGNQNGTGSAKGNNNGNANGYNNGNGAGYNNGNRGGRGVVIPEGTQFNARIEQNLRTSENSQNETISGSLVDDVSVNGNVVAPAGTPVQAQITSAQNLTFDLRLTSMSVNGRIYTLASNSVHSLRDAAGADNSNQSAKKQLGSIFGNIATSGQIPRGTVFSFRLTGAAQPARSGNSGGAGYGNGTNQ